MENTLEIPNSKESSKYNFNQVLTQALAGESICLFIPKQDNAYVLERLIDLIVEISFEKAKELWEEIKQVFLENDKNKPFIYRHNNDFYLCHGKYKEDLSFFVNDKEELIYDESEVVVSPLLLQKLYDGYSEKENFESKVEFDQYANYCISRELEKSHEKKVKKIF